MTGQTGEVLVVGAGVMGLVAALELERRGWSVRVVDQGEIPHPLPSVSAAPIWSSAS